MALFLGLLGQGKEGSRWGDLRGPPSGRPLPGPPHPVVRGGLAEGGRGRGRGGGRGGGRGHVAHLAAREKGCGRHEGRRREGGGR